MKQISLEISLQTLFHFWKYMEKEKIRLFNSLSKLNEFSKIVYSLPRYLQTFLYTFMDFSHNNISYAVWQTIPHIWIYFQNS